MTLDKSKLQSLGFWYLTILVVFAAVVHIRLSLVGWSNTLCDWHEWRQAQTAISTYYIIRDGFSVNYITPVLGKPWSIPIEFPLFQWIVAAAVIIFKVPLEQCGRFFNLLFFYFSLIPTYFLLIRFVAKKVHTLVFYCLLLASPMYIFWSRTFMRESLVVFLSLTYLVGAVYLSKHRILFLVLCCLTGTLSGLVKVTTFLIFIIPAFAFVLRAWMYDSSNRGSFWSKIITLAALFIIPLIINIFWIHYTDRQQSLNPLANQFMPSSVIGNWSLGTLRQRVEGTTWVHFLNFSSLFVYCSRPTYENLLIARITVLLIAGFLLSSFFIISRKYKKSALFFFGCYLCGPLIFLKLYYIHEYYYYANGFFLLFALGFLVLGLIESNGGKIRVLLGFLILPLLMGLMYKTYYNDFYDVQKTNGTRYEELTNAIKSLTTEEDVILIYGFEWSPVIPYYSQRKAVMDPWYLSMSDDKFEHSMKLLGNRRIRGMVIGAKNRYNQAFLAERIQKFGFLPQPAFRDKIADFYITKYNSRE